MTGRRLSGQQIAAKRHHIYRCTACGYCHRTKVMTCQQCEDVSPLEHFDSAGEAGRWANLLLLERSGNIKSLERQVRVDLHAHAPVPGNKRRIGKIVVDFEYWTLDGGEWKHVFEDYKGRVSRTQHVETALFAWKSRHLEAEYGIQIRITQG